MGGSTFLPSVDVTEVLLETSLNLMIRSAEHDRISLTCILWSTINNQDCNGHFSGIR